MLNDTTNLLQKHDPDTLRKQLQRKRQESLVAARNGDYRKVAQLTQEAARINRAIFEAQISGA
jgi:hypothetical protein